MCNVVCYHVLCVCGGTARAGSANKTKSIISRRARVRGVWPAAAEDGAAWRNYNEPRAGAARSQERHGKKLSNMTLFLNAHKTFDISNLIMLSEQHKQINTTNSWRGRNLNAAA